MKAIKRGEGINYPKHKMIKCDACESKLLIDFEDCHEGCNVINAPAYYAIYPICNHSLFYCWRY